MKWLQWLVDNAWTVVIIGGVLAQMLQAILKKKGGEDAAAPDAEPREYEFEDPELAERTRRIREEIQRKISQRQQGGAPESEPVPAPEYAEEPPPLIRDIVVARSEPPPVPSGSRFESARQAEILEQQAQLEARLRDARRLKEAAARRAEFEQSTKDQHAVRRAAARSAVLDDLKDPEALRRAFILREVLGPPVALRK